MGIGKWIGGFLGFIGTGTVLGALAGYALGSMIDALASSGNDDSSQQYGNPWSGQQGGYGQQGGGYNGQQRGYGQQQAYGGYGSQYNAGYRNGFLFCLMVLSADMIQADGKIMHSEMEYVRRYLRQAFGEAAAQQGNDILHRLFDLRKQQGEAKWQEQMRQACAEMAAALNTESRTQLIAFLAEIIKADGQVHDAELKELRQVAVWLGLDAGVADQMFALGGKSIEDAYKVLGINPDATDDEVRKAYRKMVLENHPDRVASLGADIREAATRKLQEINEAKDAIFKARGIE